MGSGPRAGGAVAGGAGGTACSSRTARSPPPELVVGGSWVGAASGVGSSPSVAVASSMGSSLRRPTRSRSLGMSRRGTATIPSASLTQWPAALPPRSSTVTGTPCAGLPESGCTMRNSQTSPMAIRGHQYATRRARRTTTGATLWGKALLDKALSGTALPGEALPDTALSATQYPTTQYPTTPNPTTQYPIRPGNASSDNAVSFMHAL